MPILLLLSQQGAVVHELSHWHPMSGSTSAASAGPEAQSIDVDSDVCLTCLGFAQIGGLAAFDAIAAPVVEGLRHHFASELVRHVAEASLPVARSRGPPLSA